jgi:hypothetical protein
LDQQRGRGQLASAGGALGEMTRHRRPKIGRKSSFSPGGKDVAVEMLVSHGLIPSAVKNGQTIQCFAALSS